MFGCCEKNSFFSKKEIFVVRFCFLFLFFSHQNQTQKRRKEDIEKCFVSSFPNEDDDDDESSDEYF